MNINITLELDAEAAAAVTKAAGEQDASAYLTANVQSMIASWVQREFEAALRLIGERAAALPYAARMALIQQVEPALPAAPAAKQPAKE